ncbi:MAG: SpoIIE family protein phosphatase [Candidatus Sulfopaludibacter sp.]|nr:SpoIIE family protein phosphatase [Candidatus Sulfopaludibacter sp.]
MIETFVDRVLLRRPESRAARIAWAVFLIVGPLAYVGGSVLERKGAGDVAAVSVDREGVIATAQQFAANRGIDTTNWSAYATIEPVENLLGYYRIHTEAAAVAARTLSPAVEARVILISAQGDRARIFLDQGGHVFAFDFTHIKVLAGGAPVPEQQAMAIARDSVESIPNFTNVLTLNQPKIETLDKTGKGCRGFTWNVTAPALPGLSFEVQSVVCGTLPVKQRVTATVAEDYVAAHWGHARRPLKVLEGIYFLYMTMVIVYSVYRYARRSLEREVSHTRTILLALAVGGALMLSFLLALDEYVWGLINSVQGIIWYPLVAVALSFLVAGLGVAVAYGAGEGDLRELYPGKMTSLDALFRGKLFSRNVARSALFGVAYAAWMLLAEGLADWALHSGSAKFALDLMKLPLFRAPVLAIFTGQVVFVTLIPASGLLLPLAFLGRRVRRPWLRTVLMVLFAALGCSANAVKYGELKSAAVGIVLLTGIMLGAFFGMDLLAVIFGLGAFEVATSMARLMALSPSWMQLGAAVGAIGLCFLGLEAWAALQGREYREEEVRPAYAGNIAQRQTMQAELAAAREAQLHLLPRKAPEIHGLFIQAACVPARIVGGDFYDFYPLGNNRLGIFIAEGGNRGIGAALSIALAKGFLMHTVSRNLSPREVIQRLESTLGRLLEGAGAATHFAYAVIDTAAGTVRYARTGDYPRVVVASALSSEQRVELPGSGTVLYEGSVNLRTGDSVLLFTDGIARRVRTTGPAAADNILKALAKKRREHELEDDLTAVVVRVTRVGALMEIVA